MKLITISGPRAAGKEALKVYLQETFGLRRIVPHTTRPMRACEVDGREHHYISLDEYARLEAAGEFVVKADVGDHRYGTIRSELFGDGSDAVIDITPRNAHVMRDTVVASGGQGLLIFVHASEAERRGRVRERQPGITDEQLAHLLASEPAPANNLTAYRDFNLIIGNPDGELALTCSMVGHVAAHFLGIPSAVAS